MKRILSCFVVFCLLAGLTVPCFAEDLDNVSSKNRVVMVGYDEVDRNVIFGDKSDLEIQLILQSICSEILVSNNPKSIVLEKYDNSRLQISVATPDEKIGNHVIDSDGESSTEIRGIDEPGYVGVANYHIAFYVNDVVTYGYYQSIIMGSFNVATHQASLTSIATTNVSGAFYPHYSTIPGGNTIYETFWCTLTTLPQVGDVEFVVHSNKTLSMTINYN